MTLPVEKEWPENSPLPYTEKELAKIASHLSLPIDDDSVRLIVGMARTYIHNRENPCPGLLELHRRLAAKEIKAAKRAAKALHQLVSLYEHGELRRAVSRIPGGMMLNALYRDGTLRALAERLGVDGESSPPPLRQGRPKDTDTPWLLRSLIDLWELTYPDKKNVSHQFLRDVLEPLGYEPSNRFEEKVAEAKALHKTPT